MSSGNWQSSFEWDTNVVNFDYSFSWRVIAREAGVILPGYSWWSVEWNVDSGYIADARPPTAEELDKIDVL